MNMFKNYFIATRPWSFPVSTMSILVTAAGLFYMGFDVNWWLAVWATIGIMIFHAAENVLSDYYDYRKGVDREDTFGSKTLTTQMLTSQQVWRYGWILLSVAIANGLAMAYVAGWQLLVLGGVGVALAVAYPWLKYHALGDVDITIEYGVLPCLGTSLFVTGAIQWEALWLMPCFVTITNAVLHANNTRDVLSDKRANIYTLPILIGKKASMVLYYIEVLLPSAWIVVCCIIGKLPWYSLLQWVTLTLAIGNCKQMHRFANDPQAINNLDENTAKQQLINCAILVLTSVIAALIVQL